MIKYHKLLPESSRLDLVPVSVVMVDLRSIFIELIEELEVFDFNDDYSTDLLRRAKAALEHVDLTRQPWPVLMPDQPPAAIWKQLATNRQAALDNLMALGILDHTGCLTPAYTNLE